MKRLLDSGYFWLVLSILVLLAGLVLTVCFWGWLRYGDPTSASNGETLRNAGLLIGGALAFVFAGWRACVAQRQAATAEGSLLNERYQRGTEMLGSAILAVRLGGIYALRSLAEEHTKKYHVQIMQLFCAFVRQPTEGDAGKAKLGELEKPRHTTPRLREDVKAIMEAIRVRSENGVLLEQESCFRLDLSSADLRDVRLMKADLSRAILTSADLSGAWLEDVKLRGARLDDANLSGSRLGGANLSGANLLWTNLSGAFLNQAQDDERDAGSKPVKGLTQVQLDWACADKPPVLKGVLDAETDKPLVWRDKPCNEGP